MTLPLPHNVKAPHTTATVLKLNWLKTGQITTDKIIHV